MTKPIIGITLDWEEKGEYSSFPYYIARENYSKSVSNAGGVALFIPHEPSSLQNYIEMLDGIVFIGGDFDIDPVYWNEEITSDKVKLKVSRTKFEFALMKSALEKKLPMLGICAGEQLLNVLCGGDLIQHIPDEIPNAIEHTQPISKDKTWHKIMVNKDSMLYKITGVEEFEVNSTHHQAVKKLGNGLITGATAPDGVIEAIESPLHDFCLGIQWHPEYESTEFDTKIIKAFINAAQEYSRRKNL